MELTLFCEIEKKNNIKNTKKPRAINNFKFSYKIVYAGKKNTTIINTYLLDILGMHTSILIIVPGN